MATTDTAPKFKVNLNLLHPQGAQVQLPLRIVKWALSYGRFIALFVELFVIGMFVYRFQLDAQLATTQRKINEQIPFVENLNSDAQKLKQVQDKLDKISANYKNNLNWLALLKNLSDQVPNGVVLTDLSIDHSQPAPSVQLKITGNVTSTNSLGIFVNAMKQEKMFTNVQLVSIGLDQGKMTFIITGSTQNLTQ